MAPTMLQSKQSEEPTLVRKRSRTASDSLDTWLCEPTTIESKEVQRPASSTSSFSSCTTQKDSKTLSLEVLVNKEGDEEEEEEEVLSGESVCVTPKAKKYRIPVVDVDLCPPAPKKARRLTVVCSRGRERYKFLQKLSFSASFLV